MLLQELFHFFDFLLFSLWRDSLVDVCRGSDGGVAEAFADVVQGEVTGFQKHRGVGMAEGVEGSVT